MFHALKAHFTSDYDYFKYNGKIRLTPQNYDMRKDKFYFAKLIKQQDPKGLIISNLIKNPKMWIGELFSEDCQEVYKQWQRRNEALTYSITQETNELLADFNENFTIRDHSHPWLLAQYIRGKISLEMLCVLDTLVRYSSVWNKRLAGDPVWNNVFRQIVKYKPFLKYNKDAMREVFLKRFDEKLT